MSEWTKQCEIIFYPKKSTKKKKNWIMNTNVALVQTLYFNPSQLGRHFYRSKNKYYAGCLFYFLLFFALYLLFFSFLLFFYDDDDFLSSFSIFHNLTSQAEAELIFHFNFSSIHPLHIEVHATAKKIAEWIERRREKSATHKRIISEAFPFQYFSVFISLPSFSLYRKKI